MQEEVDGQQAARNALAQGGEAPRPANSESSTSSGSSSSSSSSSDDEAEDNTRPFKVQTLTSLLVLLFLASLVG